MRSVHLSLLLLAACCPTPPAKAPMVVPPTGSGAPAIAPTAEASLDALTEGAKVRGFTAVALYLDAADKPFGARFIHDKTGFTFDYLRIESAPQGFIWVHSFPTSDQGEPHTQEHLLLGKGDRGRRLGSAEAMALAESSAFTNQWRTCYHFNTVAGADAFWPVFDGQLDALLHPDYTDEEIRREVRNFGVDKGDDGKLHLEEKGTVYNEMVRTYEQPEVDLFRAAGLLVYGPSHPLALESGGYPDAIRKMSPADIRKFHDANYHLANMGMVGAYPSAMTLASVLDHTAEILDKEAVGHGRGKVTTEADLPRPAPAAAGTIQVVDYPYSDNANPGPLLLAWPATRELSETDRVLLALFVDAFAGDETTTLYKKLIDSKTREIDLGATGLFSQVSADQGHPVYIGLAGVKPDKLDDKTIADVRTRVLAELDRIAKLPDGDAELVAFDRRVESRVVDLRRRLAKFLDTPPGFGFRGTGSEWIDHLHGLDKAKGFRKSVTLQPELAAIEQLVTAPANPWRDRLRAWKLLEAPFGVAARPSPARRAQLDTERKQRIDEEAARLATHYGTADPAATLARYQQDYDAETHKLEASAKAAELPPLVATPPMTLDDSLQYTTGELGEVRTFTAVFESMASSRVQLAFDVRDAIAPDDQFVLAALPTLMTDAGVIGDDGKPISSEDMREQVRKQILELSAHFTDSARTGRVELVVAGAGNTPAETIAALGWMRRVALAPDWRIDNLPRLRDLVDQELDGMRQRMLGAEESWVDVPRDAWWRQQELEYLHARSFLTQAHDLHRLRWMLADPRDPKVSAEVRGFLVGLADARALPRADLVELAKALAAGTPAPAKLARWTTAAGKLSTKARPLATAAGKDLAALLGDLPDASLAADWSYLCREMAHDLELGAPYALGKLEDARKKVIQPSRARLVEVGATASVTAIAGAVDQLARALPAGVRSKAASPKEARFAARLAQHERGPRPLFVGLVDPATSSGVFLDLAKATSYTETSDDQILDYLASNLYTGHGGHSIFMKTWAAGLAYSNGLHPRIATGVIDYYAERCPLLPQTLRFVIDELRRAKPETSIARYAIATAFTSRIAGPYEQRASAMAADLVDELPPDVVRAFRTKLLAIAQRGDLAPVLFARIESVYGRVLPGYGKLDPGAIYFVIGPEKQLAAYQDYLHAAIGKDTRLARLYPRDFWIPARL